MTEKITSQPRLDVMISHGAILPHTTRLDGLIEMKKSLIAAALLLGSLAAQAGTLATLPNKSGGLIRLTDQTSGRCDDIARRTSAMWLYVVSTSPDGSTILGCWHFHEDDDQIEVRWGSEAGYGISLYPNQGATRTPYHAKRFPDKSEAPRAATKAPEAQAQEAMDTLCKTRHRTAGCI